jgi:predicted patatin/cPLA2 family phospholipase
MAIPRRIAIACQGGGSHTAFTAGALNLRFNHEGFCDGHKIHRKTPRSLSLQS